MTQLLKTKTKIVATLGPNSVSKTMIEKMLIAGLNVVRINMSHGDHDSHSQAIANTRSAAKSTKLPVAILQDLSGPKIRIGDFTTETVTLVNGNTLVLSVLPCDGTETKVFVNYPMLPKEVEVGMYIYLNDGKQKLLIDKITETEVYTTVISGGTIRGRRGVNIPDANLSVSSLTAKDKKDLSFGLEQGVDFVTLSFVRNADDIRQLRKLVGKHEVKIVAKIETKFAIDNLDEIVEVADVIMVARGDLAIEMPLEKVPLLQKHIIHTANQAGKPVITATQMLDSMRVSTTPTRAEVTDIANAIIDGTDALMLSDETAVGLHPDLTIEIMSKIALEVESDPFFLKHQIDWDFSAHNIYDAVSRSIAKTAVSIQAKAIIAFSESGYTGRMIARYRPRLPIIVLTPQKTTFNQSLLIYGSTPVLIKPVKDINKAKEVARKVLLEMDLVGEDDLFIIGAGVPFGSAGATNMMTVEKI